jgi:hypothetical protein
VKCITSKQSHKLSAMILTQAAPKQGQLAVGTPSCLPTLLHSSKEEAQPFQRLGFQRLDNTTVKQRTHRCSETAEHREATAAIPAFSSVRAAQRARTRMPRTAAVRQPYDVPRLDTRPQPQSQPPAAVPLAAHQMPLACKATATYRARPPSAPHKANYHWNTDPIVWLLNRDKESYSGCHLGQAVSYWFQ